MAQKITQAKCNRLMRQALGKPAPFGCTSTEADGWFIVYDSAMRVIGRLAPGTWDWS